MAGGKGKENRIDLQARLEEERAKSGYYQEIARQTGRKRLKEIERLSRLIDDLRRAEADRRDGENFLTSIFESIQDGISILDMGLNIVRTNRTIEKWFPHEVPLIGKKCYQVYRGRSEPCETCPSQRVIEDGETNYDVIPKRNINGDAVGWLELHIFPLFDVTTGQRKGVIEYVRDITEKKQAEDTILHMAYHDALTGLPNRILFSDRLAMELARAKRDGKQIAVLLMDLDRFKDVNDTLGHRVGDILLQQVAWRLIGLIRRSDTVARMGGDEFMIVLPGMNDKGDAGKIAEKIIDVFKKPFLLEETEIHITPSIGIAVSPEDGLDVDSLVRKADMAMYRVKATGRNGYEYYHEGLRS